MKTYSGGCHCGAVKFEFSAADELHALQCNCSICAMTAYLHVVVPQRDFRLLTGTDQLAVYQFNTAVAKHRFCKICGIKSFYTPRSNPHGISVNARCISTPASVTIEPFDGKNWEQNAAAIAHLDK